MNNSIDESPNLGQENKDLIKQPFQSQNKNFLNHIESSIQQKESENNQQYVQQNNLHQNQDIIQKLSSQKEKIILQENKTTGEEQKINIKKNQNSDEQDQQQIHQLGDIQIDIKEGFTQQQQQLSKHAKTPYFQQKGNNIDQQNQQDEYEQNLMEQKVIKENKLYFNLKKLVKNIKLKPGFQKDPYYLNKIKNEQLKNAIEQIQDILKKSTEIYNFNSIYTKDVSLSQNKKNKYKKWDSEYNSEYLEFPNFNEQINTKHIEQMQQFMEKEVIPLQKLSKEMLKSIQKERTFDISSQKYPYPYTWKLSQWLQKGSLSRIRAFFYDYSITYRNLYYIKNRFYQKKKKNSYKNAFHYPQIFHALINIFQIPISLFGLIFGLPGWQTHIYNIDKEKYQTYQMKISEFLQNNLTEQQKQTFLSFYDYQLILNDNLQNNDNYSWEYINQQNIQKLKNLATNVAEKLNIQLKTLYREYDKQDPQYYKKIQKEIYQDYQFQLIKDDEILGFNIGQKQLLCDFLKAIYIIEYHQQNEEKIFQNISKKQIQRQVKQKYQIRSRFKKWWHKKTEQLYKEEHQKSLEIARKKIEDDLNQNNLHIFWSFIKIFLEHKDYRDHDLEKQFKQQNKIPIRTINVKRKLLFPKVIKISDNNFQYKKYYNHKIPTNFPFWRIALFFVRWFCWGFNTFLWLMKQSFIGQFSLKALFTCNKYQRHTTFNYKTGEVSPAFNRQTIRPVCYIFKNVIKGMKRSRKQFEEAPDTGLFPKGFSRICNIFECYIFRLIFVGFFLTLLGMPMLILINFFFSFILGLLALAYMPVVILLVNIFQWLFYDFDNSYDREWKPFRQRTLFPLLSYIFDVFMVAFEFVWAILLLVVHIFLSIFFIFFGVVRYICRGIYDCFCLQCIKLNGRTPSTNTCLAWQIKGPGIGIHKYKQISQNDAQILFKGFLLCKILDIFKSQIRNQIEFHYKQNQDKIQDVVINLNGKYSQECIDQGYFLTFLEKQISFRQKNVYVNPYLGQIRLNKQNLQVSMEQTKVILNDYLQQYECLQELWVQYNIKINNFDELNSKIWTQIFGNNILEPFEEIEARMEVKYLDSNINDQIENALKGKSMLQNNKTSYKYQDKKDIEYEFSMNSPPTLFHIIKNLEQFSLNKNKAYCYDYNKIDPMIVTDYIQFYQDSRGIEIM